MADAAPGLLGDADGDFDLDLADFAAMQACLAGPEGGPPPVECRVVDFDGDDDVDLGDFGGLQIAFTGEQ